MWVISKNGRYIRNLIHGTEIDRRRGTVYKNVESMDIGSVVDDEVVKMILESNPWNNENEIDVNYPDW